MKRRIAIACAVFVTLAYAIIGHLNFWPHGTHQTHGFEWERPWSTSGDEPHYLVVTNSLLDDHDIHLEADFQRIERGGWEAGWFWRGHPFGGHVLLRNPKTGKHITCLDICGPDEAKQVGAPLHDLEMLPAHPVGFPAFMALLALPFRTTAQSLEPLFGTFQIAFAILVVLLTYVAARASAMREEQALAAAGIVAVASPWLPYLRSYFSEPAIGLFVVVGYLALRRNRFVIAGAMIGVAMAMKPNNAVFAMAWVFERLWARKLREAILVGVGFGAVAAVFVGFDLKWLGVPMTTGTVPFTVADGLTSFVNTLWERDHGLFNFVPWTVIAFAWGVFAARPLDIAATPTKTDTGPLPVDARRQLILPILASLGVYSIVAWGPGFCYGPRYWVPLMPFMAILAVDFAFAGRVWRKALLGVGVVIAGVWAVPAAFQYHWMFSQPASAAILGPPPPPPVEPPPPRLETRLTLVNGIAERIDAVIHVKAAEPSVIAGFGDWVDAPRGSWKVVAKVRWGQCDAAQPERATFDVALGGVPLATKKVESDDTQIEVPFEVTAPEGVRGVEARAWTGGCAYELTNLDIVPAKR